MTELLVGTPVRIISGEHVGYTGTVLSCYEYRSGSNGPRIAQYKIQLDGLWKPPVTLLAEELDRWA